MSGSNQRSIFWDHKSLNWTTLAPYLINFHKTYILARYTARCAENADKNREEIRFFQNVYQGRKKGFSNRIFTLGFSLLPSDNKTVPKTYPTHDFFIFDWKYLNSLLIFPYIFDKSLVKLRKIEWWWFVTLATFNLNLLLQAFSHNIEYVIPTTFNTEITPFKLRFTQHFTCNIFWCSQLDAFWCLRVGG